MKNLAKICVVVLGCLVAAEDASAINPALPFVKVSVPRVPLNVGTVWGPGTAQVGGQVTAHIWANCSYHIAAGFQGFKHAKSGVAMWPVHQVAAINGQQIPVGTGHAVIAQSHKPTPSGGVELPIDLQLRVSNLAACPAGRYNGALVIRIMARP